jgi:NTE family protein
VRRAIVLSGGGARGAYEAGVLSYIFEELPVKLGFVPRIDVFSGNSVGAVHCCFLAANAHQIDAGVGAMIDLWKNMSFSTVYRFGVRDMFKFTRNLFSSLLGRSVKPGPHPDRIHGLLNTMPLEQLVVERVPWRQLRRNLRAKVLDSLCVQTTEIATGRTVVFIDNREQRVGSWTRDPMLVARAVRVGPKHALASGAIPVLFPSVRVRDTYYCDGGLGPHSPLAPALRLGCNRILAIGLRRAVPHVPDEMLQVGRIEKFHSAGFMLGKILNTLLVDRLNHDILQMRTLNRLIAAGMALSGPGYLDEMNRGIADERGLGLRIVEDCFIRPSEDVGMLAAEHVRRMRRKPANTWIGTVAFRSLTRGAPDGEADLMSYLLFDSDYASSLISLGMADAARAEEELIRFFSS